MDKKDNPQAERFREAARALECDDETRFDQRLKKVAQAKPTPDEPKAGHSE